MPDETFLSNVPQLDIAQVAKVAHEANRAFCQTIGDFSVKSWEEASQAHRDLVMQGVIYRLNNPGVSADEAHDAWRKSKQEAGWTSGHVKDDAAKTDPCMDTWSALPVTHQLKDILFGMIVNCFAVVAHTAKASGSAASNFQMTGKDSGTVKFVKPEIPADPNVVSILQQLGFTTVNDGRSFMYAYCGRGIYVDNVTSPAEITLAICKEAEVIGERKKLNEIRQALDMPFGVLAEAKPGEAV